MNRFCLSVALSLLCSVISLGSAMAGGYTYTTPAGGATSTKSRFQTIFSLGVQWDFGDKKPQVVAGVRRTQTTTQSAVYGGKMDIAIPLSTDGLFNPTVRLLAVGGDRTVQGEAGVGATRTTQGAISPLLALGAQAPFVNGGVNYVNGQGMAPYLGVNTVKRAAAPERSSSSLICNSPYYLTNSPAYLPGATNHYTNGYTCERP